MLKIILYIQFVILIIIIEATSQIDTAKSCSYDDVKYAIEDIAEGGTVYVPSGDAIWTSRINITKGVRLIGAGMDKTTIINGIENTSSGDFLIRLNPSAANNPFIEITGFTFDANSEGACIEIVCKDDNYAFTNFRIHDNKFKNTLDDGSSYMCIKVKDNCFGLIDNNMFVNNQRDFKIYGNDQNSWDKYPGLENLGTSNYLYIEKNTSAGCNEYILSSGEGARWVYRYNNVDLNGCGSLDAHGNTLNDGVVAHEIYENTFTATKDRKIHDLRGGTGIVFNNKCNLPANRGIIQIREEDCYQYKTDCDYPGEDPIAHTYLWNNMNTSSNNLIQLWERDSIGPNMIEEDRDYWSDMAHSMGGEDSCNFTYDVAAKRPATCYDDDCYWETDNKKLYRCNGTNNWILVYEPYKYPHPLSTGSSSIFGASKQHALTNSVKLSINILSDNRVSFNITSENPGKYRLDVYNFNGKKLWSYNTYKLKPGKSTIYWNLNRLGNNKSIGSGIYFVLLNIGRKWITKSFMIVR